MSHKSCCAVYDPCSESCDCGEDERIAKERHNLPLEQEITTLRQRVAELERELAEEKKRYDELSIFSMEEFAEATKQLAEKQEIIDQIAETNKFQCTELIQMEIELAESKKDAERFDFAIRNPQTFEDIFEEVWYEAGTEAGSEEMRSVVRARIDAARPEEGEKNGS